MNVPEGCKYSAEHEWVRLEDGKVRVGITDYAQDALGDVVYVELPDVGSSVKANDPFAEVESTKSVSDIYAPVSGSVIEVNTELGENPQLVNEDPYGDGWLCVIDPADLSELDALMDSAGYRSLIDG